MSTEEIKDAAPAKKEKKELDGRGVAAICGGLAGALLVLRIYQMLKITDYSTGFFTSHKNATVMPFYVILVMFVLLSVVLPRFSDTPLRAKFPAKRDIAHGAASLLLGAGIAREAFSGFRTFADNVLTSGLTQLQYIKANRAYSEILAPVFALLAFVVLLVSAVSAFIGKPIASKLRLLSLTPAMWLFTVTVGYFGTTANYLKEPQFMLLIFATVFFMLFMFEYARFSCGIAAKSSAKLFMASGVVSIGLFAVLLVPELLAGIFVKDYEGVVNADFLWWQAAAPVFALSAVRLRIGTDAPEKTVETDDGAARSDDADVDKKTDAAITDTADAANADTASTDAE